MYARIDTYFYVPIYGRQFIARKRSYIYRCTYNCKNIIFTHKNLYKHINETFKTYAVHMHAKFLNFRMYVSLARPLNSVSSFCNHIGCLRERFSLANVAMLYGFRERPRASVANVANDLPCRACVANVATA